jgi:hypothetical protein
LAVWLLPDARRWSAYRGLFHGQYIYSSTLLIGRKALPTLFAEDTQALKLDSSAMQQCSF